MRGITPGGSYFPAKAELIGIRLSYQFGNGPVSLGTVVSCLVGPSLSRAQTDTRRFLPSIRRLSHSS